MRRDVYRSDTTDHGSPYAAASTARQQTKLQTRRFSPATFVMHRVRTRAYSLSQRVKQYIYLVYQWNNKPTSFIWPDAPLLSTKTTGKTQTHQEV